MEMVSLKAQEDVGLKPDDSHPSSGSALTLRKWIRSCIAIQRLAPADYQ